MKLKLTTQITKLTLITASPGKDPPSGAEIACSRRRNERTVDKIEADGTGAGRVLQNFKALLLSKKHSDVTLKVKNESFQVHKAILGAQSSVFDAMFQHDFKEKTTGMVDITDCEPHAFQDFLLFMYSGKVEKMTTSNVLDLYTTADKYDVTELKEECAHFMTKELSVDTFCDFVSLALRHNESLLLEAGTEFFMQNTKRVLVTVKWKSFMKENTDAANDLYIKACN